MLQKRNSLIHILRHQKKFDASRKSLLCALEQPRPDGWQIVAFASSFLDKV